MTMMTANESNSRACAACGCPIIFKPLPNGKWSPCNPDGSDHWDACKQMQRKSMGLLHDDGSVNWQRLAELCPATLSESHATHTWSGEVPPWDESLGSGFREFTEEEKSADVICRQCSPVQWN